MNILRTGDSQRAAIDKERARIAALKAEIRATREAPWPKAHRDALLRAELSRLADSAVDTRNRFGKVIDSADTSTPFPELSWSTLLDVIGLHQVHTLIAMRIDALELPEGLAPTERAQRVRHLEIELFDLEVAEELAVCVVEAKTGGHVLRRLDVNPVAVCAAWEAESA